MTGVHDKPGTQEQTFARQEPLSRKITSSQLVAALVAAALSPLLGGVAGAIAVLDGWPVVFTQERAGLGGKPFRIYKFRTMRQPRYPGEPDEARITKLGNMLRRSSIDELPSLWNIVRGEMAFVGPRPLPVLYTASYTRTQARRLNVLPGLTGPVQVQGRNALTWEEKFALDVSYVDQRSWLGDLRLIARTPAAVLTARGISHPGHATMPVFAPGAARPAGTDPPGQGGPI